MKHFFLACWFFAGAYNLSAQETFFDIYGQVSSKASAWQLNAATINSSDLDQLSKINLRMEEDAAYEKFLSTILQKVNNLTFPDIIFTDVNGKSQAISHFKEDLVVNYNYLFCMPCTNRIDSTLKRVDKKNIKILVLFSDLYQKDISAFMPFKNNVLIGFINDETKDLISFQQSPDCMYFLNENRQIEFFDQKNHKAWTEFLDKRMQ